MADKISVGLNIGNTLEATGGETAWGNPLIAQKLIDGVKAAGFNAVRIPCAWDGHADANTHQINTAWMARVKQVVDFCVNDGLYVILNIHWDGGWLENHVTNADQAKVNEKQKSYWTQIATTFKGYDEHLLFAGTNEVHQDYNTPSSENIAVQQSYNQTFVDAVRATGGNNATRPLVVQTYNTNIDHGIASFTLPKDTAANRLIVEVHFYDPWGFTGSEDSNACLYWGSPYPAQSACSWAQESYVDGQFSKVKAKWVSQGIPVIIGEYGAMRRSLSGQQLSDHLASRRYYHKHLNTSAKTNGIKTFFWDIGVNGLLDRNTGSVADQGNVDAIMQGAGVTPPPVVTPYALTVTRAGAGSGTVSSSPSGIACGSSCSASFTAGTTVTLTATADGGSTFAGWSGACSGTGSCTLSMSSAQSVTATFNRSSLTPYALTVTRAGAGNGTISSSPSGIACGSSCSASFSAGTSVTLTATADGGSIFAGWSGACSGTETCTITMNAAQNVTATFSPASGRVTYPLAVAKAGAGSGTVTSSPSGVSCREGCTASFPAGTTVTLTATADSDSTFGGWNGACSGTGTCTIAMNTAQNVMAKFATTVPSSGCTTGGSGTGLAALLPSLAALILRRRRSAAPPPSLARHPDHCSPMAYAPAARTFHPTQCEADEDLGCSCGCGGESGRPNLLGHPRRALPAIVGRRGMAPVVRTPANRIPR